MATNTLDNIKRYGRTDLPGIFDSEGLIPSDMSFLSAISNFAIFAKVEDEDEHKLAGLHTVDIPVFEVVNHPTGIYQRVGEQIIIFINEDFDELTYDLISELHPQHDWDIYLWLTHKWKDIDKDLGIHGEWYRRDDYPDGMRPFTGKISWEDSPRLID